MPLVFRNTRHGVTIVRNNTPHGVVPVHQGNRKSLSGGSLLGTGTLGSQLSRLKLGGEGARAKKPVRNNITLDF